jgi:uridine kinase
VKRFDGFENLLDKALSLCDGEPCVIGIDSPCASGKTTLADLLAAEIGGKRGICAGIIHMDDFFLPPNLRTPERLAQAGGNVDYERFSRQVVEKLGTDMFAYDVYNCEDDSCRRSELIYTNLPIIVEGVYCLHPFFGDYVNLRVFVKSDKSARIKRLRQRCDDEKFMNFVNKWIPLEDKYFDEYEIEKTCNVKLENN